MAPENIYNIIYILLCPFSLRVVAVGLSLMLALVLLRVLSANPCRDHEYSRQLPCPLLPARWQEIVDAVWNLCVITASAFTIIPACFHMNLIKPQRQKWTEIIALDYLQPNSGCGIMRSIASKSVTESLS